MQSDAGVLFRPWSCIKNFKPQRRPSMRKQSRRRLVGKFEEFETELLIHTVIMQSCSVLERGAAQRPARRG